MGYSFVISLFRALQAKDLNTARHSKHTADYAVKLGHALQLSAEQIEQLYYGSLVHDLGKIGIREEVLQKSDKLTVDEYKEIKRHPLIGYAIVQIIPSLDPLLPIIRNHHERMDGLGYPDGLSNDEIPILSRIVAIADAFSAMTDKRPYRLPMSIPDACDQLRKASGTQFDKKLVEVFIQVVVPNIQI